MKFAGHIFRLALLALALVVTVQMALSQPAVQNLASPPAFAARLQPALVSLSCENTRGKSPTQGRGFFVGANFVATDYQVVKDALRIQVRMFEGKKKEARLIAVDSRWTVALLFVTDAKAEPLSFGDSEQMFSNHEVFFLDQNGSLTPSTSAESFSVNERHYRKLAVQLSPDYHGSPIFNRAGEVIGLVVAPPRFGESFTAAIPASYIVSLGQFAIEGGVRGTAKKGAEEPVVEKPPGAVRGEIIASGNPTMRGAESGLIRKSGETLQSLAIRKVIPLYPPRARDSLIVGLVVVELIISEEGEVIWVKAVSGNALLKDAATAATRGWKFKATKISGKPIRVIGRITFNFVS